MVKNYKIENEKPIRSSFLYILPVIISNIISLSTLSIFTRMLTVEDFGILALAQIFATIVVGLANFGLLNIYNRNFFEYTETIESAALLYSIILFVFMNTTIFALLTYFFKNTISHLLLGSFDYGMIVFYSLCATGINNLKMFFYRYIRNSENAKAFALYNISDHLVSAMASIVCVVIFKTGVIGLIWGQLFSGFLLISILFFKFYKFLPLKFSYNILLKSLKISYPLSILALSNAVRTQSDKYILRLLSNLGGVGIYNIAQRISNLVFVYMTAIQNVFLPQVYRRMFDLGATGGKSIGLYLTPFFYSSIALAFLISMFSEEILFIMAPASYRPAIPIIIILSMFYATLFFSKQPQLIFKKKAHIATLISVISVGITIILNIFFIIKWGVLGAAWATFAAGLISGIVFFIVSQHFYKISYEYSKIFLILLSFFGASIILVIMHQMNSPYLAKAILKMLSIGIFLTIGIKGNIISTRLCNTVRENLYK